MLESDWVQDENMESKIINGQIEANLAEISQKWCSRYRMSNIS